MRIKAFKDSEAGSRVTERYQEIDVLRGLAIFGMIVFHFFFDLDFLGIAEREMYAGGWGIFQKAIATTFLLLVGVSLTLSYARAQKHHAIPSLFAKYGKRALMVFGCGVLITLVTYLLYPQQYIVFGILHMIGVSILLALAFLSLYWLNLVLGVVLIYLGTIVQQQVVQTKALLWLGFVYPGFTTLDYYPLLPWFGVVLVGLFLGKYFYPRAERRFRSVFAPIPAGWIPKLLSWMGRRSLMIYLVHQPILIGLLFVFVV